MVEDTQNPLEGSTPEAQEAVNSLKTNEEAQEPKGSEPLESEVPNKPESVDLAKESEEPAEELAPLEHAPAAFEESDSHTEEEREAHEDHQADYSELSDEALVAEAARVLREVPIAEARLPMLALRNTLLPRLDEVRQNALDKFVAEGGVAMDFRFEQKIRESFFETFNEFKKRRTAWKSEQTLALSVNLDLKKAIVN